MILRVAVSGEGLTVQNNRIRNGSFSTQNLNEAQFGHTVMANGSRTKNRVFDAATDRS